MLLYQQGKSLSVICSSLSWLKDHENENVNTNVDPSSKEKEEPEEKEAEKPKEGTYVRYPTITKRIFQTISPLNCVEPEDWAKAQFRRMQEKKRELEMLEKEEKKKKQERRLERLQAIETLSACRELGSSHRTKRVKLVQDVTKKKEKVDLTFLETLLDDGEKGESDQNKDDFCLDEYDSDKEDKVDGDEKGGKDQKKQKKKGIDIKELYDTFVDDSEGDADEGLEARKVRT